MTQKINPEMNESQIFLAIAQVEENRDATKGSGKEKMLKILSNVLAETKDRLPENINNGRPDNALKIMRELSLGISSQDLSRIEIGTIP